MCRAVLCPLFKFFCSRVCVFFAFFFSLSFSVAPVDCLQSWRAPSACCSTVMVDMENHYRPPSPLEDSMLGSPLYAHDDFIGSMEELQDLSQNISQDISKDISQSMDNDTLSSLDIPEYQSSSNGSESSTLLGEGYFFVLKVLYLKFFWKPTTYFSGIVRQVS